MMAVKMFIMMVLVMLLLPQQSQQEIITVTGVIQTLQNWVFITSLYFPPETGRLEYDLYYPQEYDEGANASQNILLYHDIQWPLVDPTNTSIIGQSCYEKEGVLLPENNQVINLTTRYRWSGCNLIQINNEDWYRCRGGRTFSSSIGRWWYIVVDNCATTKGLYLNYTITAQEYGTTTGQITTTQEQVSSSTSQTTSISSSTSQTTSMSSLSILTLILIVCNMT